MGIAKVTTNYQVTIPRDVRELKGIKIGDTLIFSIEGERVDVIKRKDKDLLERVKGIWKTREGGLAYTSKLRRESEHRLKEMGL